MNGGIRCDNATFGDPIPNVAKTCGIGSTTITQQPVGTGTAQLSWTAPTTNTDHTPLTNLAGYTIRYGLFILDQQILIHNPLTTSYLVQGLSSGTQQFTISARTPTEESVQTAPVFKVIP